MGVIPDGIKSMTAKNCYILIDKDRYIYDDMIEKLDVFLINNRISVDEYNILVKIMNDKKEVI